MTRKSTIESLLGNVLTYLDHFFNSRYRFHPLQIIQFSAWKTDRDSVFNRNELSILRRIVFDGITYQLRKRPHNFVPFAVRTAHLLGFGFWSTTTDLSFILNYCLDLFLTIQDINTFIRLNTNYMYIWDRCVY